MRLLFQQSCLFLAWLLMVQTQYRNIGKGCEGILTQSRGLHNSQELKKVVAIYEIDKLFFSKKCLEKVPEKG